MLRSEDLAATGGALDAAPVGITLLDSGRRVLYANPRLATMLGSEVGRMLGLPLERFFAGALQADIARRVNARFTGPPVEIDVRYRDATLDVFMSSVLTVVDDSPAILLWLVDAAEPGARMLHREVLDRVAESLRSQVGDAFFTELVLTMTRVLEVDYAMVAEVDASGTQAQMIAVAAGASLVEGVAYALAGTPCADVLRGELCWYVEGAQERFPSDLLLAEMGVAAYAGVPLNDAAGVPIGLLAILHRRRLPPLAAAQAALRILAVRAAAELERRRHERELRRAKEHLDRLIEGASVAIVELDVAGNMVRANRCFEELTGYSREELAGRAWLDLLLPADRYRAVRERIMVALATEPRWDVENPLLTRGGEERIVVWRNTHLRDDAGRLLGTLSFGADVTERRRAEGERARLQESLRRSATLSAMGSLVAGVAHEVRNPLFGIASTVDAFAAEFGAESGVGDYVQMLRADVNRLRRLMNDLLEYGTPRPLSLQVQPLTALVELALRSLQARAAERRVSLRQADAGPLPHLPLDGDRIVQVVCNVAGNAVEHAAAGGSVEVTLRHSSGADAAVILAVRDDGDGFAEQDLPHVFEPFFSRRAGGSGLGLAIVQKIVVEHGGAVSAGNAPEGGGLVEVRLPVQVRPDGG